MTEIDGDFDYFAAAFPNDLISVVIRMMLDEWKSCSKPAGNPIENRITNRFVGHLNTRMRNYDRPQFRFVCRPKVADDESDSESGEIDIMVLSFSNQVDAFLSVECKRLNITLKGKFQSSAGEYTGDGGMGCFISGQYKGGGDVGVMFGYVMSRTMSDAIDSIDKKLLEKHAKLKLIKPHSLQSSTIVPSKPNVKQTSHNLDDGQFEIIHAFVTFSEN